MKWQKLVNATILGGFLLGGALVLPASAVLQDQIPGSFLVFPVYDISSGHTTQIRICDQSNPAGAPGAVSTWVRLNFVCPGNKDNKFCDEYDTDISLTSHQCKIINVADQLPPCETGFIVAFAENAAFDPWAYDKLIGSYNIITDTGAVEAANAIAIQSPQAFKVLLGHTGTLGSPELKFADGAVVTAGNLLTSGTADPDYVALPSALHIDFKAIGGPTGTTDTRFIVLTLNINSGSDNNLARVKLNWWNEKEESNSATHDFVCWDRVSLASIDSHFTFAGLRTEYGSLKVSPTLTNCEFPNGQCGGPGPAGPFTGPFFYTPAVLGALEEIGPGATIRHFFHTGNASAQEYGPE